MKNFFIFFLVLAFFGNLEKSEALEYRKVNIDGGIFGMYAFSKNNIWLAETFPRPHHEKPPSYVRSPDGNIIPQIAVGKGFAGISKHPKRDHFAICDVIGDKLRIQDLKGQIIQEISTEGPFNARWTKSGSALYVIHHVEGHMQGVVSQVTPEGVAEVIIPNLRFPEDIAPVGDDRLWVSEGHGIGQYGQVCLYQKKLGSWSKNFCTGYQIPAPGSLSILPDDSVLVGGTVHQSGLYRVFLDQHKPVQKIPMPGGIWFAVIQAIGENEWVGFDRTKDSLIFGTWK